MEFQKILEFIDIEDKWIGDRHDDYKDNEKYTLANIVKMNEEVGELCEAVLSKIGHQRKEKLKDFDDSTIGNEVSDVILTTLLVAKSMNIDVEK